MTVAQLFNLRGASPGSDIIPKAATYATVLPFTNHYQNFVLYREPISRMDIKKLSVQIGFLICFSSSRASGCDTCDSEITYFKTSSADSSGVWSVICCAQPLPGTLQFLDNNGPVENLANLVVNHTLIGFCENVTLLLQNYRAGNLSAKCNAEKAGCTEPCVTKYIIIEPPPPNMQTVTSETSAETHTAETNTVENATTGINTEGTAPGMNTKENATDETTTVDGNVPVSGIIGSVVAVAVVVVAGVCIILCIIKVHHKKADKVSTDVKQGREMEDKQAEPDIMTPQQVSGDSSMDGQRSSLPLPRSSCMRSTFDTVGSTPELMQPLPSFHHSNLESDHRQLVTSSESQSAIQCTEEPGTWLQNVCV